MMLSVAHEGHMVRRCVWDLQSRMVLSFLPQLPVGHRDKQLAALLESEERAELVRLEDSKVCCLVR
jgi:hypothetical protein